MAHRPRSSRLWTTLRPLLRRRHRPRAPVAVRPQDWMPGSADSSPERPHRPDSPPRLRGLRRIRSPNRTTRCRSAPKDPRGPIGPSRPARALRGASPARKSRCAPPRALSRTKTCRICPGRSPVRPAEVMRHKAVRQLPWARRGGVRCVRPCRSGASIRGRRSRCRWCCRWCSSSSG
ncbi:Uncharacterised protein [Mycobacteroides abscessus subsp. abscessus]|nr:Uncharacterised protein [Mycobacteroides abscessus subsp. abscessus]